MYQKMRTLFRDENYDIIDDENDGYNFVDSEECGETEQAEIFADEADTGYKIVKDGVPIEFKYDGTTLYFRLTEGATEGKLPDWGSDCWSNVVSWHATDKCTERNENRYR
ncbi:MAG: hypothetical protein ACLURP_01755 [Ruminococcus sp.]